MSLPITDRVYSGDVRVSVPFLPLHFGPAASGRKHYDGRGGLVVSSSTLALVVCSLPSLALFLSVTFSLYFHFDEATKTHCGVRNVLPSISTAISMPSTQAIWRFLIYLHAPPRFLAYVIYGAWLPRSLLSRLCRSLYLIEICSLLSLTYFDSTYDHHKHVLSFTTFGICSTLHMLIHTKIGMCIASRSSIRWKRRCVQCALLSLSVSFLLFIRHNSYCEPYVFSLFALFEYSFVLSNILFHSAFRFDFPHSALFIF